MRMNVKPVPFESSDDLEYSEATIEEGPRFVEVIIDGYSDQLLAVLREYASNAYDAHLAAGIPDVPIKVDLPTHINRELRVRDYGAGLSHHDMMNLYGRIGKSTKNDEDGAEQTGGFGIGTMVGWAASEQFTVISHHAGQRRVYFCTWDRVSMPRIYPMGDPTTTAETGLEVVIPISSKDTSRCREVARTVFKHYPVAPILNVDLDLSEDRDLFAEGEGWKIFSRGYGHSQSVHAVMGVVSYRVEVSQLDLPEKVYKTLTNSLKAWEFTVPMGSLELLMSREALRYRSRTKKTLRRVILNLFNNYDQKIGAYLETLPTDYERIKWVSAIGVSSRVSPAFAKADKDNNWTLPSGKVLKPLINLDGYQARIAYCESNGRNQKRSVRLQGSENIFNYQDRSLILFDDVKDRHSRTAARLKAWDKIGSYSRILVIERSDGEPMTHEEAEKIRKLAGDAPAELIGRLSSIPLPPAGAGTRKAPMQVLYPGRSGFQDFMDAEDVPDEAVYTLTYNGEMSGAIPRDLRRPLIKVPATRKSSINPNWITVSEYLDGEARAFLEGVDLEVAAQQSVWIDRGLDAFVERNREAVTQLLEKKPRCRAAWLLRHHLAPKQDERPIVDNLERVDRNKLNWFLNLQSKNQKEYDKRRESFKKAKPLVGHALFTVGLNRLDEAIMKEL